MSEKLAYLRNTGYVLAANLAVLGFGFISRTLVARLLGPEQYGKYALILTTASLMPVFLLFSLNIAVVYFAARSPSKKTLSALGGAAVLFVTLASLAFALPTYLAAVWFFGDIGLELVAVGYVLAICLSVYYVSQSLQQGTQDFKGLATFNALSSFAAGVLAIALAGLTQDAVWVSVSRMAVTLAIGVVVIRSFGPLINADWALTKKLFAYVKPLALVSMLTISIGTVDRYLLQIYRSTVEVGQYDIANVLASMTIPFVTSALITMSPAIAKDEKKVTSYYDRIFSASMLALTVMATGVYYLSDFIVNLLLGDGFQGAIEPLKITALTLPAMALYSLNTTTLNSLNKTGITGKLNIILAVGLTAFNLALVPTFGALGAAWASFAVFYIVAAAGTTYFALRHGVTVAPAWTQAFLLAGAIAAFHVVAPYGFLAKAAAASVFVAANVAINFKLTEEIISTVTSTILKRR